MGGGSAAVLQTIGDRCAFLKSNSETYDIDVVNVHAKDA
jgi:hypothetical protein